MKNLRLDAARAHTALFYILVLLIPVQLGRHFWPGWSFVLGRRIDYLSPTLYLTDIVGLLLLAFWSIDRTGLRRIFAVFQHKARVRVLVPTICMAVVFVAANIWFSASPTLVLYAWARFLYVLLVVLYIKTEKPDIGIVSVLLLCSLCIVSGIGIAQFVRQTSLGGIFWFLGERTFRSDTPGIANVAVCLPGITSGCPLLLRSYSVFPHPNVFGGYIAWALPFILFIQYKNREKFLLHVMRIVRILVVGISFTALLMTFSRSAMTAAVAVMFVGNILKHKKHPNYSVFRVPNIVTALLICAVSLFILNVLRMHAVAETFLSGESVSVRLALAASAIQMISDHPVFGVGLGNFISVLPRYLPSTLVYHLQPVHSIYVLIISEIGILGASIFAYVAGLYFVTMQQSTKQRASHSRFIPLLSCMVLFLVGMVDHYPLTLIQGQLMLAISLGFILSSARNTVT